MAKGKKKPDSARRLPQRCFLSICEDPRGGKKKDMAKLLIAKGVFNRFLGEFLEAYCKKYPQIASAQQLLSALKSTCAQSAVMLDMYLDSFRNLSIRLKAKDETLLLNEQCLVLRYLQLSHYWTQWTTEEKEWIWTQLIGAYLTVELFERIPPKVMTDLEQVTRQNYLIITENKPFDRESFSKTAQSILMGLEDEQIEGVTNYIWEFVTSPATPVYSLVAPQHHSLVTLVLQTCRSEEGKQMLMERIAPYIDDIKTRVGHTTYGLDEDEATEDESKRAAAAMDPEVIQQRKKEKLRVLSHVVDVFSEAIDKNKDAIKNIMTKPTESLQSLFVTIFPALTRASAPVPRTAEQIREEAERDDVQLFGTMTIPKRY